MIRYHMDFVKHKATQCFGMYTYAASCMYSTEVSNARTRGCPMVHVHDQ